MANWPNIPMWEGETPEEEFFPEFHSVYTVQLGELIASEYFKWDMVPWSGIEGQTERLQKAFVDRFFFREISMLPPREWLQRLFYKLEYELRPKYALLYKDFGEINAAQLEGEYLKSRDIRSTYPETELANAEEAYASEGKDYEEERIKTGDAAQIMQNLPKVNSLDGAFLDELEPLFVGLMTTHINGF